MCKKLNIYVHLIDTKKEKKLWYTFGLFYEANAMSIFDSPINVKIFRKGSCVILYSENEHETV